jgi:hypothetical protein
MAGKERSPRRKQNLISSAQLRELLEYFPNTGEWWWRVDQRNGIKAGDLAGCIKADHIGRKKSYQLRKIMIMGRTYTSSRLAWFYITGEWPAGFIDHRNNDSLDDRWDNLRLATASQNKINAPVRSDSKSGIKGVYYDPRRKTWSAQIGVNGKRRFLGRFASAGEAQAAYKTAAGAMHGEFARF